jgi:hypothetical protein
MKPAVEMGLGAMIYTCISNLIKIASDIYKLTGRIQTHRHVNFFFSK